MKALTKGTTFDDVGEGSGCDLIEYRNSFKSEVNGLYYHTDHILMRCRHCSHWYTPDSIVVNIKANVEGSMCVFCAQEMDIAFGKSGEHSYNQIVEEFGGWYV